MTGPTHKGWVVDRRPKYNKIHLPWLTESLQFDVTYQELEPTELQVVGIIPAYTAGVLFGMGSDLKSSHGQEDHISSQPLV